MSPTTEKELGELGSGLTDTRTKAAQILARSLVVHVLTAADELRSRRRTQLREREKPTPVSQKDLDLDRIMMMDEDDEEDEEERDRKVAEERKRLEELEKARLAEQQEKDTARELTLLAELDDEVGGGATPAQLSVSGAGKEVTWFAKNGRDEAVRIRAAGLVARWKNDVGSPPPVSVAALASELETAVHKAEPNHRPYLAKVRELASLVRHAPAEIRRGLLDRSQSAEDAVGWPREKFWSPSKVAAAQAAADEVARKSTFATTTTRLLHDATLQCPSCGHTGADCDINEYGDSTGGRRTIAECTKCRHKWQIDS